MAANIIVLLGSCARSEHQAVGGGGRRDLQELLHKDGPLQEEGRHRKKYKKDGIGCGKDYKITIFWFTQEENLTNFSLWMINWFIENALSFLFKQTCLSNLWFYWFLYLPFVHLRQSNIERLWCDHSLNFECPWVLI